MRRLRQWFSRSSNQTKVGLMLIATFLVFGGLGLAMRPAQHSATVQGVHTLNNGTESMDVTKKSKMAVTKTEIETTEEEVPFSTTETYDGTLLEDTTVVRIEGRNGKKVVRTEVKTKDGEVNRSLISETITVPPVRKVIAIGTKVPPAKPSANKPIACDPTVAANVPETGDIRTGDLNDDLGDVGNCNDSAND